MRKALVVLSIVTAFLFGVFAIQDGQHLHQISFQVAPSDIEYPLYLYEPGEPTADPQPQRGAEFNRWLAPSVRIRVPGAAGSGTICHFDATNNLAYVISCGHLWSVGAMSAEQGKTRNLTCTVEVFYHNSEKLAAPERFTAKVLFYSHIRGADYSLLTFTPTWRPTYFPIAPLNYTIPARSHQHSVGCDHASEAAHYDVVIRGMQGADLITENNSPRPGRSGGGLMTDDGYYIGICWGTSDRSGNGIGYFTPLQVIHPGFERNGFGWILNQRPGGGLDQTREIPIIDRNGPQRSYQRDYIPLPSGR